MLSQIYFSHEPTYEWKSLYTSRPLHIAYQFPMYFFKCIEGRRCEENDSQIIHVNFITVLDHDPIHRNLVDDEK